MNDSWPELKFSEWQDTLATLHMWTQVVGKIRLKQTPLVNHWWNVPLYVSARGLTTTAMPYRDGRLFEIEFDFIDHKMQRRGAEAAGLASAVSRCFLRRGYGGVARAEHRNKDLDHAGRDTQPDSF